MNTRTKRITAAGASIGAIAAVLAGVYAFGATASNAQPEPTPTPTVYQVAVGTTENGLAAEQEADAAAAEAARIEAERVAAEAAAAAEAARIEAERVAAEEAARAAQEQQRQTQQSQGGTQPAQPAPTKCPAGTTPGQVDGNGNESMCQTPCSEWVDNDGDGTAETCARP